MFDSPAFAEALQALVAGVFLFGLAYGLRRMPTHPEPADRDPGSETPRDVGVKA